MPVFTQVFISINRPNLRKQYNDILPGGAGGQEFPPIPPERFRRVLIFNNPRGKRPLLNSALCPFYLATWAKIKPRVKSVSKNGWDLGVLPFRKGLVIMFTEFITNSEPRLKANV